MVKALVTWIGHTDIRCAKQKGSDGLGPIGQALSDRDFDEVHLLSDLPQKDVSLFIGWLDSLSTALLTLHCKKLSGPTQFGEIYNAAKEVVSGLVEDHGQDLALTFHLSPGTPAMAAIWILLAKSIFPAELIESSIQEGVHTASVPFDISAEFLPDLLRGLDDRLARIAASLPAESAGFDKIVYRSAPMKKVALLARKVAMRSVPVLIEGESGTGKELFARAIHAASLRRDKPFMPVNCGAIPSELIESTLFGHERGAFTGADRMHQGFFEAAGEGTLFLDEIGELPLAAQVKLLRAIQEKEITRVGAAAAIRAAPRIIAATNRNLLQEVADDRFRKDLFYRIAVAVIRLPPLRQREGDVGLLADYLMSRINHESKDEPGYRQKKLSPGAKNLMARHAWPGNVREMENTLMRAAVWSADETLDSEDIREALLTAEAGAVPDLMARPLGNGFNIKDLLNNLLQHYLARAMAEANGNKSRAAKLLGLPNYQTLSNWLNKYQVQ